MRTAIHVLSLTGLLALAACNQTASPPGPESASATPAGFRMPQGTGCTGEIDRYRAVMSNDLAMGHVNQSVYNQVDRELRQAESACAGGRDAEAVRLVHATKARHGYL